MEAESVFIVGPVRSTTSALAGCGWEGVCLDNGVKCNISDVSLQGARGETFRICFDFQSRLEQGGGDGGVGWKGGECWSQGGHIENPGIIVMVKNEDDVGGVQP